MHLRNFFFEILNFFEIIISVLDPSTIGTAKLHRAGTTDLQVVAGTRDLQAAAEMMDPPPLEATGIRYR